MVGRNVLAVVDVLTIFITVGSAVVMRVVVVELVLRCPCVVDEFVAVTLVTGGMVMVLVLRVEVKFVVGACVVVVGGGVVVPMTRKQIRNRVEYKRIHHKLKLYALSVLISSFLIDGALSRICPFSS